jgi:hypothetical protein
MTFAPRSRLRVLASATFVSLLWVGTARPQIPSPPPASTSSAYDQKDAKAGLIPLGGQWGFHAAVNSDPSLPNVLLIGDSILIGYGGEVAAQLRGKANVSTFTTGKNIGLGDALYSELGSALAHGPFAVIHFNDMGLHGYQKDRIPDARYEPLLRTYLDFLKTHSNGAKLIWTTTTPLTVKGQPTELDPINNVTIVQRNGIAAQVVQELGLQTDDLYALMSPHLDLARGDQFHWTKAGQILQGDQAAKIIEAVLAQAPLSKTEN